MSNPEDDLGATGTLDVTATFSEQLTAASKEHAKSYSLNAPDIKRDRGVLSWLYRWSARATFVLLIAFLIGKLITRDTHPQWELLIAVGLLLFLGLAIIFMVADVLVMFFSMVKSWGWNPAFYWLDFCTKQTSADIQFARTVSTFSCDEIRLSAIIISNKYDDLSGRHKMFLYAVTIVAAVFNARAIVPAMIVLFRGSATSLQASTSTTFMVASLVLDFVLLVSTYMRQPLDVLRIQSSIANELLERVSPKGGSQG